MAKKQKEEKFNLEGEASKYKSLKIAEARAKDAARVLGGGIIGHLKKQKLTKAEGEKWVVTLVEPEDTDYDLAVLQEELPKKLYKQCVKEVPDKEGILSLINSGKISAKVVAKAATVTPKAPYILVNPKK